MGFNLSPLDHGINCLKSNLQLKLEHFRIKKTNLRLEQKQDLKSRLWYFAVLKVKIRA